MLLTLRPIKFVDSLSNTHPSSMDKLCERTKSYIQMEEMSRFKNEVQQVEQKRNKWEGSTKTDSYKS